MWRLAVILCACLPALAQDGIVELSTHVGAGVRSAWLANGVRVHHKQVGTQDDDVVVTIRLIGGAIDETDDNRGVTQAAMAAWLTPRTRSTDADAFAERLEGFTYEGGYVDADMIGLEIRSPARRLGPALRLLTELIAEPDVDVKTFEAWRTQQRVEIQARAAEIDGRLREVISMSLYPVGDPRVRPLTIEDLDRLTLEQTTDWLARLTSTAPIEVGIAGPIDATRAIELAGLTLSALPKRKRIMPHTFWRRQDIGPRPEGPISTEAFCERCNSSVAILGLYAPDRREIEASQRLFSALILLDQRLARIEWGKLDPKVEMLMTAGRAFPGYGMLYARVEAPRETLLLAVQMVEQEVDRFMREGPTEWEMSEFHAGARMQLTELLDKPDFWSSRLAVTTSIGAGFDELDSLMDDYTTITAEEIKQAFAEYARPSNRFTLVVLEEQALDEP